MAHLRANNVFRARGVIDATMSKTDIRSIKVVLYEVTTRVANTGRVKYGSQKFLMYDSLKTFPAGSTESFDADIVVPPTVIGYTAIGNIFSRSYFLALEAETFCCYSNPKL